MHLAWFAPARDTAADPLDDTADLVAELASDHHVELFDAARAHDFIWLNARRRYDLCVYELANTAAHDFIWPYVLHFPGVLRLRGPSLHDRRALMLHRGWRADNYGAELTFSGWDLLRVPLLASRLVVVADAHMASLLAEDYAGAIIRHAPLGIGVETVQKAAPVQLPVRFGVTDPSRIAVVERAAARARRAGAHLELVTASTDVLREADVILALDWPSKGEPPAAALAGMARSKPVVVLETEATAVWPALDPQTWQPRALAGSEAPIVASIDPRDEEHSLVLAMRRLATNPALRAHLGSAAFAWWRLHATGAHAAAAWRPILAEAAALPPPPKPSDWPPHLTADGTERAREILAPFGVTIDVLQAAGMWVSELRKRPAETE